MSERKLTPLDRVFDQIHAELGSPYVPRMNRRWVKVNGQIQPVAIVGSAHVSLKTV